MTQPAPRPAPTAVLIADPTDRCWELMDTQTCDTCDCKIGVNLREDDTGEHAYHQLYVRITHNGVTTLLCEDCAYWASEAGPAIAQVLTPAITLRKPS